MIFPVKVIFISTVLSCLQTMPSILGLSQQSATRGRSLRLPLPQGHDHVNGELSPTAKLTTAGLGGCAKPSIPFKLPHESLPRSRPWRVGVKDRGPVSLRWLQPWVSHIPPRGVPGCRVYVGLIACKPKPSQLMGFPTTPHYTTTPLGFPP